jgi:hypothetical protein
MHRIPAKFVRLLTHKQKPKRVTVKQELFDRSNVDENFLKNAITGDETWVYGYDIKTKVQSSQLLTVFFFDWKGVIQHEFVPRDQTVNGQFYLEVMKRLREAV